MLLAVAALCVAFLFLPTTTQSQTRRRPAPARNAAAASAAWQQFFPRFVAAVKAKDKEFLRTVMSRDFKFTYDGPEELSGTAAFLRYIDNPKNFEDDNGKPRDGWKVLEFVLSKKGGPYDGDKFKYQYPFRAETGKYVSFFEFRNGKWLWTYFMPMMS